MPERIWMLSLTVETAEKICTSFNQRQHPPPLNLIHCRMPHLTRELYTSHVSGGHRLSHLVLAIIFLSGVSLHNMPEIQVDPTEIPELKRETSLRRQTSQIKITVSFPRGSQPSTCPNNCSILVWRHAKSPESH